ncbi:MAG: M66 family metalloprotease [Myxococcales bacterium]|nr:M66 family metalloprotease [Myxococcales bacterium]
MIRRLSWLCLLLSACDGTATFQAEAGPVDGIIGVSGAPKVTGFRCAQPSVEATVPLSCTAQTSHPKGSGLSCRLESSSGERVELGDCSGALATSVRLMTPGQATLKLVVSDAEGQQVERTVSIEVLLPPNQPPRITRFTASRMTGVTPFSTTLQVDAADPDSSDVRCELTPGGPVPCSMGQQQLSVTQRGATTVTLTVRDGRGAAVTETLSVMGVEPVGDVRVEAISLGQSVVAPDLKLIEGKPALVVASVLSDAPALTSVVEVVARRAGVELGRQRMTGPATHPTTATDVSRQYRATLPADWVVPGVELAVVADVMEQLPESNEQNNELRVTPTLSRRHVLHLTSVPVVVSGVTSNVVDLKATMVAQWPFADLLNTTRAPYTTSQVPTGSNTQAWAALLSEVAQLRGVDGSSRHYYGFVRVGSSGVAGIGYIGQPTGIGRDDSGGVASHELGHNFGRPHAPCGGAAGADPSYPYAGGRIGSWGWNGQSFMNPSQFVDLMSYCNPTWISDYTYRSALGAIERDRDYAPTPPQAMVLEPSVVVAVVVRDGVPTLQPLHAVLGARSPAVDSGWSVRLTATSGRTVLASLSSATLSESDEVHLLGVVEDVGALESVELVHHGVVVLRQTATPVALEKVQIARVDARSVRVTWNHHAAPFLTVAHFGSERTTLTLRATGGAVVLAHDGLEGGQLELSASSGVATVRQLVTMP